MTSKLKKGIIIVNLGSPESTKVSDVRKYLNQFLMDGRVIDKPWLLRTLLVRGIIVPFRASGSAKAYKEIWTDEGSPLILQTEELKNALQDISEYPVEMSMRYGNPTPEAAFNTLLKKVPDLEEVIVFPLYPHYAMSSYETAVEFMKEYHKKKRYSFKLKFVDAYFKEPAYINALSESMRPYLSRHFDHLLFSYHGVPERHIHKSDITGCHCLKVENCCEIDSAAHQFCYRHQVTMTTKLVMEKLQVDAGKYSISFQSRLGGGWLTPYTDIRLKELPAKGIKNLLIVCPAFVSDCLETLEEIEMQGRQIFLEAGGESYTMIPCLNAHPLWVKAIASMVNTREKETHEQEKVTMHSNDL